MRDGHFSTNGTALCKRVTNINSRYVHESYIGSKFTGRIESVTEVAGHKAILPSIEGWAKITGYNQIIIDDDDPYSYGFQVI